MRARSYAAGRAEMTASTSASVVVRPRVRRSALRAASLAQPHRPHDVRRLGHPGLARGAGRDRDARGIQQKQQRVALRAREDRVEVTGQALGRSARRRACRECARADPPRGGRAARRRAPPLRSAPPRRVLRRRRTRPRRGHPGCPRADRAAVRRRAGGAPPAPPAPRPGRPPRPGPPSLCAATLSATRPALREPDALRSARNESGTCPNAPTASTCSGTPASTQRADAATTGCSGAHLVVRRQESRHGGIPAARRRPPTHRDRRPRRGRRPPTPGPRPHARSASSACRASRGARRRERRWPFARWSRDARDRGPRSRDSPTRYRPR